MNNLLKHLILSDFKHFLNNFNNINLHEFGTSTNLEFTNG